MKNLSAKITIIAVCALFAVALVFGSSNSGVVFAYNNSTEGWEEGVFNNLDYGIYWYQKGREVPVKWDNPNANFDSSRPTVIFTHGMKQNEGFYCRDILSTYEDTRGYMSSAGVDYNTEYYEKYIDMGYNVGHFYWNQLSEESINGDKKIWSSDTDLGMRYFVSDEGGNRVLGDESKNPTKSVSVLYAENIISALGENYNGTLHLIGHSMGGNLTLAVAENLSMMNDDGKISNSLVPTRVTMLDPYLSVTPVDGHIDHRGGVDAKGKTIAELCSEAVVTLANRGVAIDGYGAGMFIYTQYSSLMGQAAYRENPEIIELLTERFSDNCVWVHLDGLDSVYGMTGTHCVVPDYFFLSLYQGKGVDNFGDEVPCALSTADEIYALRGRAYSQTISSKTEKKSYLISDSDFTRVDRNKNTVNLIVNFTVNDVYGAKVLNEVGEVVYSRNSNAPINRLEIGLEEGAYTIEYYNVDGETNSANNQSVAISEDDCETLEMNVSIAPQSAGKSMVWLYALLGVLGGITIAFAAACAVLMTRK